jgi:hypothetical protein
MTTVRHLLTTGARLLLAGAVLLFPGCSEEDDPASFGSEGTTNVFAIEVQAPPYDIDQVGVPLSGAEVLVHFVDTDNTEPGTTDPQVRAERQGITGYHGTWACNVTYKQTGEEAADAVRIWVTHPSYGTTYGSRPLANGAVSAVLGVGLKNMTGEVRR